MIDHVDVAGYVLGALTPQETNEFEAHLDGCARCRAGVAELGPLPALLASAQAAPPPLLRQRTFDAIAAAGSRTRPQDSRTHKRGRSGPAAAPTSRPSPGSSAAGRPPAAKPPAPSATGGVVVPFRPRRRPGRWIGLAAAALLLVAAVGVGAVLLTRASSSSATTVALVAAQVGSGHGNAVIQPVKEGRQVRLEVFGLPANESGTYYECWFVGPGDTEEQPNRVSVGTFTVGTDGTATVVMTSSADPARYPKMGVTLEPDDGNPGRTGPKYLVSP
jgi:anti-sigma factor RsiW